MSKDKAGWPKLDVRSPSTSIPEFKTSDRKEGEEDVANVPTCRQQSPVNRGGKRGAKSMCADWKLGSYAFQAGHD